MYNDTHDYPECTRGMRFVGLSADWCEPAWQLPNGRVLFQEEDGSYLVLLPLYNLWEECVGHDVLATYPSAACVDYAHRDGTL